MNYHEKRGRIDLLEWARVFWRQKPGPRSSAPETLMWLCLFEWAGMLS